MRPHIIILALAITLATLTLHAQNPKSLNAAVALMYPQTAVVTLSYEAGTRHHHAWEFFATASSRWNDCPSCHHVCPESFWKDNRTWNLGIAYKPCLTRARNTYGSLRLGASLGSDSHAPLGILHVGYEHNYSLKHGWRLFWQVKCDCLLQGTDILRTGIAVGVKIPTTSTR